MSANGSGLNSRAKRSRHRLTRLNTAKEARLRYVTDEEPGIRRVRAGRGFRYVDSQGRAVADTAVLQRIYSLAIPPAWEEVWICPSANGHLQAVGRDARRRKQYRYHSRWREMRDGAKYDRLLQFGQCLARIRRRTARDLRRPGLPRDKVLAAVVLLLQGTLIRVGNEEYSRQNRSFGLTTMRDQHASVNGHTVRFEFRGKGGVAHGVDLQDRRLARVVRQCQELPGQQLFQYVDDRGVRRCVGSADVNDYIRRISGRDFTAKNFRTWAGTVLAAGELRRLGSVTSITQRKQKVVRAVEAVARRLGNTKSVCRRCYVHPAVIEAYLDGTQTAKRAARKGHGLGGDESALLTLLRRRRRRDAAVCKPNGSVPRD